MGLSITMHLSLPHRSLQLSFPHRTPLGRPSDPQAFPWCTGRFLGELLHHLVPMASSCSQKVQRPCSSAQGHCILHNASSSPAECLTQFSHGLTTFTSHDKETFPSVLVSGYLPVPGRDQHLAVSHRCVLNECQASCGPLVGHQTLPSSNSTMQILWAAADPKNSGNSPC